MKQTINTVLVAYLVLMLAGVIFVFSGVYDIGATSPHGPPVLWLMEQARIRSIKEHARGIVEPANFHDPAQLAIGTEHFAAHCAVCHGAPGVPRGEIAEGLYPQPPNLALTVNDYTASQLFWIVKNGIKMTGMPGWSDHTDAEIWATVAFIQKLPGMSNADYAKLVMASMMQGGHHHGGMEGMKMPGDAPAQDPKPTMVGARPVEADPHKR
ncbi:MAG: cytochrome c [Pseudomonadota bacterium]|nr:cytochrome c [Pseudomonadota bacterium]